MINRIKNIILTIGFVFILIIPAIQVYYKIFPEIESSENRNLDDMPKLQISYLDPFPSRFEPYFNDHFSLRNQLVSWNFYFSSRYMNKSPLPDKVLFGKKGWIYFVPREFDEYRQTNQMPKDKIDKIVNEMVYRKNYLSDRNIKMYFIVAPIKYNIYPEYLPSGLSPLDKTGRTEEIKNALISNGIDVLELRDTLTNLKDEKLLYYKTDNHWNNLGGFYASQAIINNIRKDFPAVPKLSLKDYKINDTLMKGQNLAHLVKLTDYFKDTYYSLKADTIKARPAAKANYPIPKWFSFPKEYEIVYQTSNDSLPNLLFIRDSFGNAVVPYLNECFNKSVFIFDKWQYTANEHIIENEKPDIVVFMVLESFWDGFLEGVEISESKRIK